MAAPSPTAPPRTLPVPESRLTWGLSMSVSWNEVIEAASELQVKKVARRERQPETAASQAVACAPRGELARPQDHTTPARPGTGGQCAFHLVMGVTDQPEDASAGTAGRLRRALRHDSFVRRRSWPHHRPA